MNLSELLERSVEGLGYEFVDLEQSRSGSLVRVFIDKVGGVTVDDCARVSNHCSRLLAAEAVEYERLEVSSPGLDRVLKRERDFHRFRGEEAKVHLKSPVSGRRRMVGKIIDAGDGVVALEVDGTVVRVETSNLERARLVPRI